MSYHEPGDMTSKPRPMTAKEKMDIYYIPQLEEDIRPWYKRLRDEDFWRDDLKIGTVRNNCRILLTIIDNLLEYDNIAKNFRLALDHKKAVEEIDRLKEKLRLTLGELKEK